MVRPQPAPEEPGRAWRDLLQSLWVLVIFGFILVVSLFGATLLEELLR